MPFSRGVGVGEAPTIAKGIAAIGAEVAGARTDWGIGAAAGAEAPAPEEEEIRT